MISLKPCASYTMNFKTRWCSAASILLAVSFFLRVIQYTILSDLSKVGAGELIFFLILPLLLCCACIAILRLYRFKQPLLYAIAGAAMCLLLIVFQFSGGGILRILLSVVWYLLCGALLVGTALGYVPWRLPATAALALALVVRLVFFDLGRVTLLGWIPEGSDLCILAGLVCLSRCFRNEEINA